MTLNEIKQKIRDNCKIEIEQERTGGQTCGIMPTKAVLYSEELDLRIEFGYKKSQLFNKQFAYTLFELALDDLIK